MTLEEELRRGRLAASLLENEVFVESMNLMRDAIISQWENSPIRDTEGHHELRLMIKLLQDLRRNIQTVFETGKLAKIQIEQKKF